MSRSMSHISIMNYMDTVKPKLQRNENMVLEALENIQPATAEMVAESMGWPLQSVSGRFTGLKNKRKIVLAYKGFNSRGRTVAYYRAVPDLTEREYTNE